ncbi:bifunctional riboflavin kinase/FAD synthetase [Natronincola ferrireducens]|uniref:Riboflavin biosynthesis protein n=1 Tax=Natronincola ferrireducens TaxID=393762 RepID=A0A1G9J6W1_9FIRM|nr:bifunctional riboflavin kinase/FAD synthetase [Natronincola ferrireducens]SDL33022.1 riboflavin kinase / FMN adenylyltransferase [Natronincola ferrireducens]
MRLINGNDFKMDNTCVAFGQFDGLHRGHRAVIDKLIEQKNKNLTSVMLSFDYNPTNIFGVNDVIYTEEEKQIILGENPPDVMISYPFTSEMAAMKAEVFIKDILVDQLGVKVVVAGENCRFGKDCSGNIETLKHYASIYGYDVICLETIKENEQTITSSIIREAFEEGFLDKANHLLGHIFKMLGEVVHGKAIGRTVGMPTANLGVPSNKLIPKHGVYATLSEIDGEVLQGLTNIGLRPSVDDHSYVTIETFLLDFSRSIYGKKITLDVHSYIRGVQKFKNIDEVKNQVDKDIESIRSYLNAIQ